MKKIVMTGANGTIGKALRTYLRESGIEVIPWRRDEIPIDDEEASEAFLKDSKASALFHLAVASTSALRGPSKEWVNGEWPELLAHLTRRLEMDFLFTSTVSVFADGTPGPLTIETSPNEKSGYGRAKFEAERKVLAANPASLIVRLGWQICRSPGSNNMVDYLHRQMQDSGEINASTEWYPACSFTKETARVLWSLMEKGTEGLYMLDSNAGYNFFEIAKALAKDLGFPWAIKEVENFVYDQRMSDPRVGVRSIREFLPSLRVL